MLIQIQIEINKNSNNLPEFWLSFNGGNLEGFYDLELLMDDIGKKLQDRMENEK